MAERVRMICAAVPGNVAAFFPSYDFLGGVALRLRREEINKRILEESRELTKNERDAMPVDLEGVLYGPDGKTPYSWRVAILPYVEQMDIFRKYHLDEPWDSPHNRTLIDKMPAVYRLPISENKERGRTNYLLPVGNGAGFTADKPTEFKDIRDGTSNTIMVVEVDDQHAAIWTKPDDWPFDPKDPAKGLGHFFDGGFNAAFFDGSVHFSAKIDAKNAPRPVHPAGGEAVKCVMVR